MNTKFFKIEALTDAGRRMEIEIDIDTISGFKITNEIIYEQLEENDYEDSEKEIQIWEIFVCGQWNPVTEKQYNTIRRILKLI